MGVKSGSELAEPSTDIANALQAAPVTGVRAASPDARFVTVKLATGGLLLIVSVIEGPATTPGIGIELMSTNFTSVMLNVAAVVGFLMISNATLARRLPFTVADRAGEMLTGVEGARSV